MSEDTTDHYWEQLDRKNVEDLRQEYSATQKIIQAADALATAVKELNHPQFCAGPHGGCLFCPVMSALAAYEKARGLK